MTARNLHTLPRLYRLIYRFIVPSDFDCVHSLFRLHTDLLLPVTAVAWSPVIPTRFYRTLRVVLRSYYRLPRYGVAISTATHRLIYLLRWCDLQFTFAVLLFVTVVTLHVYV